MGLFQSPHDDVKSLPFSGEGLIFLRNGNATVRCLL